MSIQEGTPAPDFEPPDGTGVKRWKKVPRAVAHAEQMLEAVSGLSA